VVRINLVPPSELTDQHLIAEHDEILMLCGALQRTQNSKIGYQESRIASDFLLGKGHIYFFFNKGEYLHERFIQVQTEMRERGFHPTKTFPTHIWPSHLYNNYTPTQQAFEIIRERIKCRINLKPSWYRYRGKPYVAPSL